MKRVITLIFAVLIVGSQSGCAAIMAFRMPGPTQDELVQCGMHRSEVEGILGIGPSSQYEDHGKTVARYEYSDGPPQASKARAVLYLAGDVFTLMASEIVFWPIELYATERIKRVSTAEYEEDVLVDWVIARHSGEELEHQVASDALVPPDFSPDEEVELSDEPIGSTELPDVERPDT